MTFPPLTQSVAVLVAVLIASVPLGRYIAKVFMGERVFLAPLLAPLERLFYRIAGVAPDAEMTGAAYLRAVLVFSVVNFLALYLFVVGQAYPSVDPATAFNIAVSFVTNTNWQAYAPETTLTAETQQFGLAVQNFLSAATGLAVAAALARGLTRQKGETVGSFWRDVTRGTLYILLPLACLWAALLLSQGVVQSFGETVAYNALDGKAVQMIPTGPVASQDAIKLLGSNGGGFFGANAAHPFENPTPLSNALGLIGILLLPAALPLAFGRMAGRQREGWVLLSAMLLLFLPLLLGALASESGGATALGHGPLPAVVAAMEGKEQRFGVEGSVLWSIAASATSNGSMNAALDSFRPLSSLAPLLLIQFGEVVFGGVGSGLYGLLVFVIFAVFIAGLMIGRTPDYLGKKIGVFEMKMAALALLLPALATLGGTALATLVPAGQAGPGNPGPQGFTEILYAFSSAANNNGSGMGGLAAASPFYQIALGLCMLIGRFGVILPVLGIAGSMAKKTATPPSAGTLKTGQPLFVLLLVGTIVLIGVLTYVPALALGPLAAQFASSGMGG